MRWQPGDAVIWAALLVPFSTKLPLATTSVLQAYVQTPMLLWLWLLQGGVSLWLLTHDRWLGLWGCWWTLTWLWHPTTRAYEVIETLVLGAFALRLLQSLPREKWAWVRWGLVTVGVAQILWQTAQWAGWDWTWYSGFGPFTELGHPAGTFGNGKYLGVVLGILTPLAPLGWLPVFAWGLVVSKSVLGMAAALVGLLVTYPRAWKLLALVAVVGLAVNLWQHAAFLVSWTVRLDVWLTGLAWLRPWEWLVGRGPGAWLVDYRDFPVSPWAHGEGYFIWAHNDLVQLLYEGGLVAVLGLVGWLWAQRTRLQASPWRGAGAALALVSCGFSPWHLATTGLVALVVLGGATMMEEEEHDDHRAVSAKRPTRILRSVRAPVRRGLGPRVQSV